jgi:hypothetical protein
VATPPTIVTYTETGSLQVATTTGRTTGNITVQAGDKVVIWGGIEDSSLGSAVMTLSFAGGLTGAVTKHQFDSTTSSSAGAIGSADVTGSGTITGKAVGTDASSLRMNCGVWVMRNHNGIGVTNKAHQANPAAPLLALPGIADNSALLCAITDWAAANTARTYRQVNGANPTERGHFGDAVSWHYDAFDYADSGPAGTATVGESLPSSQTPNTFAVEVLAVAAPAAPQLNRLKRWRY